MYSCLTLHPFKSKICLLNVKIRCSEVVPGNMSQGRAGLPSCCLKLLLTAADAHCAKPLGKHTFLISCARQTCKQWTVAQGMCVVIEIFLTGDVWWEHAWTLSLLICEMWELDDISVPFPLWLSVSLWKHRPCLVLGRLFLHGHWRPSTRWTR